MFARGAERVPFVTIFDAMTFVTVTVFETYKFPSPVYETFAVAPATPDETRYTNSPGFPDGAGPVAPVKPVAPVDPVAPVAPSKPVAPVDPVAPSDPTYPAGPVDPVKPVAPVAPFKPVAPKPVAPVAPLSPINPVAPSFPVAPVAPANPSAPVAPVAPIGPPAGPVAPVFPLIPVAPVAPIGPPTEKTVPRLEPKLVKLIPDTIKEIKRVLNMRFHALGVQHTVTSKEYVACAFTQKVLKFCSMMTLRGHTVIHYGHEDSDVECTEHVTVLSREDYNSTYGDHDFRSKLFKFDTNDDAYKTFNGNAIREINERKQPGDILLAFWGAGHQAICDGAGSGMKVVEPGIGYPWGHFAEYKIFESYAMYHAFLQRERVAQCSDVENQWSKEAVIPNYFELCDFVDEVVPMKDRNDYFLFVGRIGTAKGVQYAIHMTERLGVQLLIAGQNAEEGLKEVGMFPPPKHVEIVGHVDAQKRKTLMANARAVVCMSTFAEPFCGVHVEALMSGTPVITADWGAFTEINMHGVTGFRCRTLDQMVEAGRRIHEIDPLKCRTWAVDNFSTDRVAEMYEAFFEGKMIPIDRTTRKVAVWCETKWALGRIGRAIKKYVPGQVDLYNWATNDDNEPLWKQGGWKQYDAIISNTSLHTLKELYGIDVTDEMRRRFVVIAHCPRFEGMKNFQEKLEGYNPLSRYAGVSRETCEEMEKRGVDASYIPFGADTDVFPRTHRVTGPIRRLGIIGGKKADTQSLDEYTEYVNIKGLGMFEDICQRGGFEPVFIFGRDGNDLYTGIDALICCSQLEGGPLGIFEAASCGIPVLTRRVGNAQYVKGIVTFDTADEALRQLDIWNGNVDGLREYAKAVTKEVRINWSMRTLINRHLVPVLENSHTLDFIEIGTSDFSTEIQEAMGRTGLSIEPIQHYLDALPDVEGVTKVRAAVSDYDGYINVYNVHPDLIKKYQLPDWVRGCNSVNNYHPTVLKIILEKRLDERELFRVERVPVMTFSTLIKKHNVRGCRYLKIDTEGHDVVILNSYLECVTRGEFSLAPKIQFEATELTPSKVTDAMIEKMKTFGYMSFKKEGDNIVAEI